MNSQLSSYEKIGGNPATDGQVYTSVARALRGGVHYLFRSGYELILLARRRRPSWPRHAHYRHGSSQRSWLGLLPQISTENAIAVSDQATEAFIKLGVSAELAGDQSHELLDCCSVMVGRMKVLRGA